jgi:hypothetical protein
MDDRPDSRTEHALGKHRGHRFDDDVHRDWNSRRGDSRCDHASHTATARESNHRGSADQTSFWFNLVNSNETGVTNLNQVLGSDARLLMRDWTLGVLLDDLVPGVDPKYQQPSWNYRVAVGGYPLSAPSLPTAGAATPFTLNAGGTVFARFGVDANQEAYVSAAGSAGAALPKNVLLALVRTK